MALWITEELATLQAFWAGVILKGWKLPSISRTILPAQIISTGKDPSRAALEALALEGYRTEQMSEAEIRQLLGFETRSGSS